MTLDFNETCILNQTLTMDSRDEYIRLLVQTKENTGIEEIRDSIDSLIDKISVLDSGDFSRLRRDRDERKIFTWPPYTI